MSELLWVYITAGEMEEAQRIGRTLVEKRLAACVNLVDKMHSIYWRENDIQEDSEVVMIAKTKATLLPQLVQQVKTAAQLRVPLCGRLANTGRKRRLFKLDKNRGRPRPGRSRKQ